MENQNTERQKPGFTKRIDRKWILVLKKKMTTL